MRQQSNSHAWEERAKNLTFTTDEETLAATRRVTARVLSNVSAFRWIVDIRGPAEKHALHGQVPTLSACIREAGCRP